MSRCPVSRWLRSWSQEEGKKKARASTQKAFRCKLTGALGARLEAPHAFDAETALQLLFEKTDQTLVAMQVKNKPI